MLKIVNTTASIDLIQKSTRVKVAVIFAYFRFSLIAFCVVARIEKIQAHNLLLLQQHKKSNYTKPEIDKNNYYFCPR
jgi:hypothetical protein